MRRGYRLLTGGGLLAGLVLAVLDVVVVLDSWTWWRGDALWASQQIGGSLLVALPVLVVTMAMPPVLRGGWRSDLDLMPVSSLRARTSRFVADALPPIGVHLTFVAGALLLALGHGDRPPATSLALTLGAQVGSIAFVSAVGRAIGELVRHPVAIGVAAATGAVLVAFAENALPVTAGSSAYAGLELAPTTYVVAATALAVATCLALLRAPGRWAFIPAALAVAAVVATSQHLDPPRLRPSGTQPTACERAAAVDVCVFPGYRFMLDDLTSTVRTMLEVLERHRIDPHLVAVAQTAPGAVEAPGTVPFSFVESALESGKIRPAMVRATLLNPTWCPRLSSVEPLPEEFDIANVQAFHWLEHAEGATDDAAFRRRVPRFAGLPDDRQRELVQEFFDRNETCEGLR